MSGIVIVSSYDEEYFKALKEEYSKQPDIDPSTKVIFLDVDGVLVHSRYIKANPDKKFEDFIDPGAVARLNTIVERTGAKIIISSSWRLRFLNEPKGFNKMVAFFKDRGITNIAGMTPELKGKQRCHEIIAWLKNHKARSFVIIDDDLHSAVDNRLVKTMFEDGLLDHHIDEAVRMLNEDR